MDWRPIWPEEPTIQDLAAILHLQRLRCRRQVLISDVKQLMLVDLDVHQGDGSAACFAMTPELPCRCTPPATTFSKVSSDVDIPSWM